MAVLREIEDWFSSRSNWEWEAYLAIREGRPLDEALVERLSDLCEQEAHSASKRKKQRENVDAQLGSQESVVVISSVSDVRGINKLTSGQILSFAPEGLTVVYGDNGAGKSSYGRILRQVCHARGTPPKILGNVFSQAQERASALITYLVDGRKDTLSFSSDRTQQSPLYRFSIFDSKAASVLVDGENEAAFRPFGLDILDQFTAVGDRVRTILETRAKQNGQPHLDAAQFSENTRAGSLVRSLHTESAITELSRVAAPLSTEQQERRTSIRESLEQIRVNDPRKLAEKHRIQARKFESLAGRLKIIAEGLSKEKVQTFASTHRDFVNAKKAAETARSAAFSLETLADVGCETWKRMWASARLYSCQHVYNGNNFPYIGHGAQCVLCGQELSEHACRRFQSLEEFVSGNLQEQSDRLEKQVSAVISLLKSLPITTGDDSVILGELSHYNEKCANEVSAFLSRARNIAEKLETCLSATDISQFPQELTAAPQSLLALIQAEQQRAEDCLKMLNAEFIQELQKELQELEAQTLLYESVEAAKLEIARLQRLNILEKAKALTATNKVSRLSSDLTKRYVTDALCRRFSDEVARLGLGHIDVQLTSTGARKGVARHLIRLNASNPAKTSDVVSEGEFRCLALAAFFAEVAETGSGILLDDPVCSLDHHWRERLSARLLEEAAHRQVIVFTHDVVFVCVLDDLAEKQDKEVSHRCIERRGNHVGLCTESIPWKGLNTKKRSGMLKERTVKLRSMYNSADPNYELAARDFYGALRESWERAIEECLFGNVVARYRRSIETKRIKKAIAAVNPDDYEIIDAAMTRCSSLLRGHDDAQELNSTLPTPDECAKDFAAFEEWTRERLKAVN